MAHTFRTFVTVVLALAVPSLDALAQRRPPGQLVEVYVDAPPPPPTLDHVWQSARLVIRGRVLEATTIARPTGGSVIEYRVLILSILKEDDQRAPSNEVVVAMLGGELPQPDGRIVRTTGTGAGAIKTGDEGFFFLSRWAAVAAYTTVNAGHFAVRDGVVTVPAVAQKMPGLEGRTGVTSADFLALMKSRRGR